MTEIDQSLVTRIVEAALLASSQPLTLVQLKGLFPLDEPASDGSVEAALSELQATSAQRGVELVEVASGWRYQVQADVHPWVARLWSERQTKYTRATLETLALIAYRQPITRGEIEQIRGVTVNSSIIKALEEREWIRVVGHRDVPGKPELLATTKTFLDYFGLKRLDELPPLSELKDIGELEPQLPFAPAIPAGMAETAPMADEAAPASGNAESDTDAIPDADTAEQPDADADTEAHETPDDAAEPDDVLAPTHDTNTDPLGDDANSSADSRASSEQKDEQ
jgi:segregation and condensation protein B